MFCCTVKDNWGMILSSLKSNTQVFSAFMSQHQHRSCHATNAKTHLFGSPPASVICKEGKQKNGRKSGFSPTQSIVLYSWESGGKSTLLLNSASWSSQLTSLSLSFFNYKVMSITVSISHRALMRCKWNNTKPLLECMAHWKYPVNGKREFNRRGWDGQGTETWNIKRFHSLCWPHSMKSLRKQLSWTNATETKWPETGMKEAPKWLWYINHIFPTQRLGALSMGVGRAEIILILQNEWMNTNFY